MLVFGGYGQMRISLQDGNIMNKEPTINGDEHDWCSGWRRLLCVFENNTGLGKKVKRAMNRRARRRAKDGIQREGR